MTDLGQQSNGPGSRARDLQEFAELIGRVFVGGEIDASVASYVPRPTDIVIAPFAKCGTTWLQQSFHTLRTRGDMDFDDISRVVPWIETANALGLSLDAPQRAEPRGFKSHLPWDRIPKGAKYVVALREPKDALVSGHRFMEGWVLEDGAISTDDFVAATLATLRPGSGYFHHLRSWWEQRDDPSVLLMTYEAMSADPERHLRRLAAFCGIVLDPALLTLTLRQSSLEFMLAHRDRYDDLMMRQLVERRCGISGQKNAKVRQGQVGSHRSELSQSVAAAVDAKWRELITPSTGLETYEELSRILTQRE